MTPSEQMQGIGIELRYNEALRCVIASSRVAADNTPADEAWLHAQLAAGGWHQLRFNPEASALLLQCHQRGTAVESLRLAEAVDAQARIDLSADGMEALLTLIPPQGGAAAEFALVAGMLAEHGIAEGIDRDAIDAAIADPSWPVIVARGRPPEHGIDGHFEKLLPEVRSRTPRIDETGTADYRELGDILVVQAGAPLMRRHPPQAGIPGRNLRGESLPARDGEALMFASKLDGSCICAEDPDLLIAATTGQPVEVLCGVIVEPVFTLEAVTLSSGNIHFDGSVVIKEDVAAGMKVSAKGDIEVGGVVELATLDAGGCISVKGGVIGGLGRKGVESPVIHCGGSFEAGYVQNARIEADDSIMIDDTAVNCELVAAKHIMVGRKRKGCIVGGHHHATLSVTAKQIGSPQRTATFFEIGVNPSVHKRMLELAQKRDGMETQLLDIAKLIDFAAKNPGKLPAEKIDKARVLAASLSREIAVLRQEHLVLNRQIELAQGARVNATERMFEGVEVQLGVKKYKLPSEFKAVSVGLTKRGELGLLPIDGSAEDSI